MVINLPGYTLEQPRDHLVKGFFDHTSFSVRNDNPKEINKKHQLKKKKKRAKKERRRRRWWKRGH